MASVSIWNPHPENEFELCFRAFLGVIVELVILVILEKEIKV